MKRPLIALAGLAVLLMALLSATVELHSGPHPEGGATVAVDLAATHASETGHIETSDALAELLCPACLVLLQTVAGPESDTSHGAVLAVEAILFDGHTVVPLRGAAGSTASRAPPPAAV